MDEGTVRRIVREEIGTLLGNVQQDTSKAKSLPEKINWVGMVVAVLCTTIFVGLVLYYASSQKKLVDIHSKFSENDFATLVAGDMIVDRQERTWEVVETLRAKNVNDTFLDFGKDPEIAKVLSIKKYGVDNTLAIEVRLKDLFDITKEIQHLK